ncbi:unnamed protein product [Boreogadus saida]
MWGPFLAVLRSSRGPGAESVWLGVKEERKCPGEGGSLCDSFQRGTITYFPRTETHGRRAVTEQSRGRGRGEKGRDWRRRGRWRGGGRAAKGWECRGKEEEKEEMGIGESIKREMESARGKGAERKGTRMEQEEGKGEQNEEDGMRAKKEIHQWKHEGEMENVE